MQDQLDLQDIVLLGRTFDEYYQMFQLDSLNLQNERILDVASGVSSFCAEANARGYNVTASDRIYNLPPRELEHKGKQDLNNVMWQLPELSHLYRWDRFRSVEALRTNRERALSGSSLRTILNTRRKDMCQQTTLPVLSRIRGSQSRSFPTSYSFTRTTWTIISTRAHS